MKVTRIESANPAWDFGEPRDKKIELLGSESVRARAKKPVLRLAPLAIRFARMTKKP
jgi:hypothetical protein